MPVMLLERLFALATPQVAREKARLLALDTMDCMVSCAFCPPSKSLSSHPTHRDVFQQKIA